MGDQPEVDVETQPSDAWASLAAAAILSATDDLVTVIDETGTIRYVNEAAARWGGVGLPVGEMIFDTVHPDDVDAARAYADHVLDGEDVGSIVLRLSDGASWLVVEARVAGRVDLADGNAGHVVMIRDVSEREHHRQRTESTRRLLETVVRDLEEVVVILDASLSVKWASPGIERLVDAPAYTNVGESAFNDIHPDDLDRVTHALEEVMSGPTRRARLTFRLGHTRLGWRTVDAVLVNFLDDPSVDGIVCTLRDATDQHDTDAELRRLREQDREEMARLREADRLKDAFLATVSHELRTPLTSVRGFAEFLVSQGDAVDASTAAHLAERIASNARDMEDMVSQLLDFSRLEAGAVEVEVEPVELGVLVDEMLVRLEPQLAEHDVVRGACEVTAMGDPDAVNHVLRNLLTNAARYSHAGSRIEIWGERSGGEVQLHVRDEGIGIDPADHGKIYQSFYQAAPASTGRRGTGIGLNIARRFAQLQGGHLRLDSAVGKGSTFTLVLADAVT